eukprot:jgi/Mesvir1/127/Mv07791-RA.1
MSAYSDPSVQTAIIKSTLELLTNAMTERARLLSNWELDKHRQQQKLQANLLKKKAKKESENASASPVITPSSPRTVASPRAKDEPAKDEAGKEEHDLRPSESTCVSCNLPMASQAGFAVRGDVWHAQCFVCEACKKPFPDNVFVPREVPPEESGGEHKEKFYCLPCHIDLFAARCVGCGEVIRDSTYLTALGGGWHERCFVCTHCKKPFPDSSFMTRDDKAYCAADFNELFAPRCTACHKPILVDEDVIHYKDNMLHPACFRCAICACLLTDKFHEKGGATFCSKCYDDRFGMHCLKCTAIISGSALKALGGLWHPECLTCTKCDVQLTGIMKDIQGKPYCKECAATMGHHGAVVDITMIFGCC